MKWLSLIILMLSPLSAKACNAVHGSACNGDLSCCVDSGHIATCEERAFSPQGTWAVDPCNAIGGGCLDWGGGAQCV
jgi:hypothetical protein